MSFNHNLEVMKITTYIKKCHKFDAVTYILTFTKNGTVAYITKTNRVLLKRGCFIGPQNQRFRLKKGCFVVRNPWKGGVFETWVRAWYTLWSGVGGGISSLLFLYNDKGVALGQETRGLKSLDQVMKVSKRVAESFLRQSSAHRWHAVWFHAWTRQHGRHNHCTPVCKKSSTPPTRH